MYTPHNEVLPNYIKTGNIDIFDNVDKFQKDCPNFGKSYFDKEHSSLLHMWMIEL